MIPFPVTTPPILDPELAKRLGAANTPQNAQVPIPAQATKEPAAQTPIPKAQVPTGNTTAQLQFPAVSQPIPKVQIGPEQQANIARLQHIQSTGPGASQVKNPIGRVAAGIGDALVSGLLPRFAPFIPGTTAHHNMLLGRAETAVKNDQTESENEDRRRLQQAQAENQEAEAEARRNPQAKPATNEAELFQRDPAQAEAFMKLKQQYEKAVATHEPQFVKDGAGNIVGMIDGQGKLHSSSDPNLDPQAKAIMEAAKPKETTNEAERPLNNVEQINQALADRWHVLNQGPVPQQYQLGPKATNGDFAKVDKLLEAVERSTGTKAQQEQANEMRRQTMAIAQQNRANKEELGTRQAAVKAYEPALESAERFNVMTKNYEDAVKNHDQQAMLSLLANHLGMTMGLQKGSRLTRDIIREAEQSRPWLQGLQAKFDKDGYLTGVNLTPPQMRQMVDLGRERFAQDIAKGRSLAKYQGATDEGPERTPSKATVNHYVGLANGDKARAKQLLEEDGWTVR